MDLSSYLKKALLNESRDSELNIPKDFSEKTDDEILDFFKKLRLLHHQSGITHDLEFYAGITNDIPQNLSRHNIDSYLGCVKVDSFETAKRIEGLLNTELGFYIGKKEESSAGRGGTQDSTIVYLAKRDTKGFKD